MAKNPQKKQKLSLFLWLNISVLRGNFSYLVYSTHPNFPGILFQGRRDVGAAQEDAKVTTWPWCKDLYFCVCNKKFKGSLGPMPFWN